MICNEMIPSFHLVPYLFYYCKAVIYKSFTRRRFGGELNINLSITSVCKQIDELLDCQDINHMERRIMLRGAVDNFFFFFLLWIILAFYEN